MTLIKNNLIKIPKYIQIFYLKNKKLIIFKHKEKIQIFKFSSLLEFLLLRNKLYLTISFVDANLNSYQNKIIETQQSLCRYRIKLCIVEIIHKLYKKLSLIGVGYKVFKVKSFIKNDIFLFKLGFSHFVFLKVKKSYFDFFCLKNIKIYITGNFFETINISALIKSFKKPEIYKGKGIRFQDEKIVLKQVKKK